jgi:hypothetical protein
MQQCFARDYDGDTAHLARVFGVPAATRELFSCGTNLELIFSDVELRVRDVVKIDEADEGSTTLGCACMTSRRGRGMLVGASVPATATQLHDVDGDART